MPETNENKNFDQALYFEDCLKALMQFSITKKIEIITAEFKKAEDLETRRDLANKLNKLLAEKNKLK